MAPLTPPNPRALFAERLRALRALRGFERARYFASALGIEENRYTRYERAEVEPSLALIHKMCATLGVTPNELLGFAPAGSAGAGPAFAPGMAEEPPSGLGDPNVARQPSTREQVAWRLATEAVSIRGRDQSAGRETVDPLVRFRDAAGLFRRLQSDPFVTISEILESPGLDRAGPDAKARLADLIATLTEEITSAGPD